MADQPTYPDHVLFQRVEQIYQPAENWPTCQLPMTTRELLQAISEELPGFFDDPNQVLRIMRELHFRFERNENNNKFYWLINPA